MIDARHVHRALVMVLAGLMMFGNAPSAFAYLKFGFDVNGQQVTLKWNRTPVRYFVNNQDVGGVTAGDFQSAVAQAFVTWQSVPTASITYEFGGFTSSIPGDDDGVSTLGFLNEPALDRVLASTSFLVDNTTGALLESDIFFNSAFTWSVAPNGEPAKWDVQTIATHEIGHFSGLGHSAIGETQLMNGTRRVLSTGAVMFPIALGPGDISGRTLDADDIAGISDIYPDDNFNARTGSISGQVTKNGQGVFGAHVVAFDIGNGDQIANFTLTPDGRFSIAGLRPGPHAVRIEPLDDADTDSFFDPSEPVDLNFHARFFDRLVIVPRGGDSGTVQISVSP
ncbi:MAG TPA: matrixin family metalloprotease [Vicinamibacterales bacterium]